MAGGVQRNVAKIFAHLLHSDSMPWTCLEYIRLNEEETTSSSRIFIKILFQARPSRSLSLSPARSFYLPLVSSL